MANSNMAMIAFFVIVAIVGIAIVPVLALSPNFTYVQVAFRQPLVGGLFSALCVLGILAALYPLRCKKMFDKSQNPAVTSEIKIVGHHPDCEKYDSNRIQFAGRNVCAACSGLLCGAILALAVAGDYFFVGTSISAGSVTLLLFSEVFMLFGVGQIFFKSYVKVMVNLFFVIGSSIALIEVDLLARNLLSDFYMLGLIAYVLWLRIALSKWHNRKTCQNCRR